MEQINQYLSPISQALGPYREVLLPMAAFVAVTGTLVLAWRIARRRAAQRAAADLNGEWDDDLFTAVAPALAAQMPESKKAGEEFQKRLRGAGLYSPHSRARVYATRFLLLVVPLIIAGGVAVYRAPHDTFATMLTGGIVAATLSVIPSIYVTVRRRRRMAQVREGLPDAMDMLSMCMEGGVSVSESLTQVAGRLDNYPALAQELGIVKRQAEVGNLSLALSELAKRVDLPEMRSLCSLLSRGDQLGTEVSRTLGDQSDHLRTQRRQRATIRANRAPVKLVLPLVFCLAPAALIMLVSPAVLELKEFLIPSDGNSVLTARESMASTDQIVEQLRNLEQDLERDFER